MSTNICSLTAINAQTPNQVLKCEDIPENPSDLDRELPDGASFPSGRRYVPHWLVPQSKQNERYLASNNANAAFKNNAEEDEPSAVLLHYTYGSRAVNAWGKGIEVLTKLAKPPRPSQTVAAMGPSRRINDRNVAINKRDKARELDGAAGGNFTAGTGTGGLVKSEGDTLDGDEVMLFFWANSKDARERRVQQTKENARRMESWRNGVVQGVVTSF